MASKPGILTDWPWTHLGRFKCYSVLAPWVVDSVHTLISTRKDGDHESHKGDLTFLFLLFHKSQPEQKKFPTSLHPALAWPYLIEVLIQESLLRLTLPETEQEKMLWEDAEARDKLRKRKRGERKKEFENGEEKRLKALWAEGRVFCDMPALANRDSILLRDTCLEYSLICQPQQRNIHGRIFGGFLMDRVFELAYSTAYAFAGMIPCFLEVDHVDFLRPLSSLSYYFVFYKYRWSTYSLVL